MKDVSSTNFGLLILAVLALAFFSAAPAYCQTQGYALLLQQTPAQGGTVSPDVGVHHFGSGVEVTLVAIPRPGYNFIYWLGDVIDPTASKTTAILDEPKIIIAVFQQVEEGQVVVGTNATRAIAGGGGSSSFKSPKGSAGAQGGRRSQPPGSNPPGEGDDPFDPPDDPPNDPPNDPPDVPEPATCLILSLGGLALLRKRRSS